MKITMDDFINMNIAVRTGTGKNLYKFLEMCEERGLKWRRSDKATDFVPDQHGADCCIAFDFTNDMRLGYSYSAFYKKNGGTVVAFSDIVSEQPKPNTEIEQPTDDSTLDALIKVREYIDNLIHELGEKS